MLVISRSELPMFLMVKHLLAHLEVNLSIQKNNNRKSKSKMKEKMMYIVVRLKKILF